MFGRICCPTWGGGKNESGESRQRGRYCGGAVALKKAGGSAFPLPPEKAPGTGCQSRVAGSVGAAGAEDEGAKILRLPSVAQDDRPVGSEERSMPVPYIGQDIILHDAFSILHYQSMRQ